MPEMPELAGWEMPSVGKALWSLLAKGTAAMFMTLLAKGTAATTIFMTRFLWSLLAKGTAERD